MIHSTGIHHVNKGFFVVCSEQNPETITTNIESRLWTSLLRKTGQLSHYKLPILSFPVKPVYPLSHYDQTSLTKPVCSAVLCDLVPGWADTFLNTSWTVCISCLSVFWTPGQPYFYWLWSWIELHLLWAWRTRHKVLGWLVWGPCDRELCDGGGLNVRNAWLKWKKSASWFGVL